MINFSIAVLALIILVCIGIPVAYSMGISSVFYILLVDPQYLEVLPNRSITGVNNFLLLAIPFFILAAEIMGKSGLTSKLFNFVRIFVGRFQGGFRLCDRGRFRTRCDRDPGDDRRGLR